MKHLGSCPRAHGKGFSEFLRGACAAGLPHSPQRFVGFSGNLQHFRARPPALQLSTGHGPQRAYGLRRYTPGASGFGPVGCTPNLGRRDDGRDARHLFSSRVATDPDQHLDELFQPVTPLTDLEMAEIVLGYLDVILNSMDRQTLATFRARYVAQASAHRPHPAVLHLIDRSRGGD